MDEKEIALAGGNINLEVVRIDDTVRRTTNPNSPTVHRLLSHLYAVGYNNCPEFEGIENNGWEIL